MTDPTMSPDAAYGSNQWCATSLGKSKDWFFRNRKVLEADGFPQRDPIIGLTLKADVHAWIAKRRRISDLAVAPFTTTGAQPHNKENLHAF